MPKTSVGEHTPATLQNLIDEMERAVRDMAGVRDAMDSLGIKGVQVKGQAEMIRAMQRITKFAQNAEEAVQNAKLESGRFGVGTVVDMPPEKPANGALHRARKRSR